MPEDADVSGPGDSVESETVAFFPAGWTGICRVSETVGKVYLIG